MIDPPAPGRDVAGGDLPFVSMGDLGLDRRKVTQCALSRICGVCGQSLSRPVAFLGSTAEVEANAFHFPPCHLDCAMITVQVWGGAGSAALGQPVRPEEWTVVTTSGFEYVRPTSQDEDRRAVFVPNSLLPDQRPAL